MRFWTTVFTILVVVIGLTTAVDIHEFEAKRFIDQASVRYFKLYNEIAKEIYKNKDDEDFEALFNTLTNIKRVSEKLIGISKDAAAFDLTKIFNQTTKNALISLSRVADLFILEEDYFNMAINIASLKSIASDQDIDPYLDGANQPNHDSSSIAYYPDIQRIFQTSNDPEELKYYWKTWRDKNSDWSKTNFDSILESLRNAAKKFKISILDFWYRFYKGKNIMADMDAVMEELKPVYEQWHAFLRYALHRKYGSTIIDPNGPIPDHLYQQLLDQVWTKGSIVEYFFSQRDLPPYNEFVESFDARKLIDEAERFFISMGFNGLDEDFYENRLIADNENANEGDCRAEVFTTTPKVLMKYCKKVDFKKFMQNHQNLARIHYAVEKRHLPSYHFQSYSLPFAVGEAVILSASTPKHLKFMGLTGDYEFSESSIMNRLFRMGIHTFLNLPLYYVHNKVMVDLFEGADIGNINKHYWKLLEQYAGIEAPLDRPEGSLDFPYKFYLDIESNHQTEKFVSEILGYQFYKTFCKSSGFVGDLHNCDFYGSLRVGDEIKNMMSLGSSKPWREVIATILGKNAILSGEAVMEYYQPIFDWIKMKNLEHNLKIGWNKSQKRVI